MIRLASLAVLCALSISPVLAQSADSGIDPAPATPSADAPEGRPAEGGEGPPLPVFQRRSGQSSGGPANELNTGDSRATEAPPGGSIGAVATGSDLYHGNYCGSGDRGADLPPTDTLDAACQRHDQCYDATDRSCDCDATLRREALAVAGDPKQSRELRKRAAIVSQSTDIMACSR